MGASLRLPDRMAEGYLGVSGPTGETIKGNFTPPSEQLVSLLGEKVPIASISRPMQGGAGYARDDDDFYLEPDWLVHGLISKVDFVGPVHDPCCGKGTIPMAFLSRGFAASGSDLRDRGFGMVGVDFMRDQTPRTNVVSNPPFGILRDFIDHALEVSTGKVAVITRLAFLEGQSRKPWFESLPMQLCLVSSRRASMPPGNSDIKASGTTIAFCWLVFSKGWSGEPRLAWT